MLNRRPATAYVFKNAHHLQSANGSSADAADVLLTLAEIAEQSKRTHVLFGHTRIILEWLRNAEIARAVSPCVLSPYDLTDPIDNANFVEVLKIYDKELPWAEGESLLERIKDVDGMVYGSVHRLRKWLVQSLCKASAEKETKLSWDRVFSARLTQAECGEALKELQLSRGFQAGGEIGSDDSSHEESGRSRGPRTPGTRLPDRNGVAA
jgi:hypothetical protein